MSTEPKARGLYHEDEEGNKTQQVGWLTGAKQEDVEKLVASSTENRNGRSPWYWLRMANGDLMLVCFPQGDTYVEFSDAGVCDFQWETPTI